MIKINIETKIVSILSPRLLGNITKLITVRYATKY